MRDATIVVLHRPRDVRNIGAVVRAMKNMGFARLRLVDPAPFEPADILGIAHRSEEILAGMERHASLESALADAALVVGTSEHAHAGRPMADDPRALAGELAARGPGGGPVALLFGPEDNGLGHAELDRCHLVLRLPADPAYPSLNLAQAALLLLYELRMAAAPAPPPPPPDEPPASAAELEQAMDLVARAIAASGFVKSGDGAATLRSLRLLLYRARPSRREAALVAALARAAAKGGPGPA